MILEGVGLHRRYGAVLAVGGVDLAVAEGEIVGLLGPNGAGKSTAFRLLAGLERPDRGLVRLAGKDVTRWPLHRRARSGLAWLPQHPSVLPRVSARENVAIALRAAKRPPHEAAALLEAAGLGHRVDAPAGTLSGGERRRLELVRCLAIRPLVVLLDEPFAGVDPAHVADLMARIRAMAAQGLGVLLTDHAVREALGVCSRVLLLDQGTVQVTGSPAEVAADDRARKRYLGEDFRYGS